MVNVRKILSSDWCEAVSISLFLYAASLLLLSLISISIETNIEPRIIIESFELVDIVEDTPKELTDISVFDQEISVIKQPSEASLSIPSESQEIVIPVDSSQLIVEESKETQPLIPSIDNLNEPLSIGSSLSQESSVGGVLDRLTVEIINNALNHNINVIWVLDASISLSKQRTDIKDRFQKITEEISFDAKVSDRIKHTIVSFGSSYQILTENPTNDNKILTNAIDSIKLDESGIENIFTCIEQLCQKFKSSRNMIIVFTDEVGDDLNMLDRAAMEARKKASTVYVVGPPAPFGLDKIQFRYVDPDPKFDQTEKWVEINQGPETPYKMTLDLHSLNVDTYGIDSGFGPYALNKICADTGGVYFAVHPNRNNNAVSKKQIVPLASYISVFFDSNVMRKYPPDYRNILLQNKEIQNNKIKQALIQACTIPINITYDQRMVFTAFSEGEFVEQLNNAQKFSAKIEPRLDQVYNILKSVEVGAKNLSEKRWLVSYNLAMGRILATKCRIELYNLMLAEAKSGLKKKDQKNNIWTIEYDINFTAKSSTLQKNYESAQQYLQSIVDNFPNTPWAYVAKAELDTPMGYKWTESYKEQIKINNTGGNNNNTPPQDDTRKKIEYKPSRNIKKI
jgi:hypothetical protein